MPARSDRELLVIDGREVAISNPQKVLFPKPGYTKLDLARYYLAVAGGALNAAGGRPNVPRPLSEWHRRRVFIRSVRPSRGREGIDARFC
jgi:bifunctional non-homologous end joining protein LigD